MSKIGSGDRTFAALSLALGNGRLLEEGDIDLSDPEQCRFGAYTLLEHIGSGGSGLVYRAHQASLERDVAIKLLNTSLHEGDAAHARFRLEARSAAALNHPNIVQILEIGEEQGLAFIAMGLVRGQSLGEWLAKERPAPKAAVAMILKLCDAVGYAHRLGLLHLDLKPANVMIDERGEPLIADFGLARRMDPVGQVQAQEVSGTPGYMAPEQVLIKQFRLSPATDVYALGAILYEMLCGQSPHGRGPVEEVIQRALAGQIPPPRSVDPRVPADLEAICLKCLGLRAVDRYSSVEALADDLRRFASGLPVSVRRPRLRERAQQWYAREPRFAAALGGLLVVALACSALLARLYQYSERQRAGAEGFALLLMEQTPNYRMPVLPKRDGFRVPIIDCLEPRLNCGGGLSHATGAGLEAMHIDSLREWNSKLGAWYGNASPGLRKDLASTIKSAQLLLHQCERADALSRSDSADGLLFGYLLSQDCIGQSAEWYARFDRAQAKASAPWQLQALAGNCFAWISPCSAAMEKFRAAAPDNAAGWMMTSDLFPTRSLSAKGDQRLLRAAASPVLDHGHDQMIDAAMAFAPGFMATLDPAARVSAAEFAREVVGDTLPFGVRGNFYAVSFDFPTGYCMRSLAQRNAPTIEEACRRIYGRVGPGVKPMLGDEIDAAMAAVRLSNDPVSHAGAVRRYRNARWLASAWSQLSASNDPGAAAWIGAVRARGELASIKAMVAKAGLPLDAPAEFVTREPLPWPRFSAAPSPGSR